MTLPYFQKFQISTDSRWQCILFKNFIPHYIWNIIKSSELFWISKLLGLRQRDNATYNWPWENKGRLMNNPTVSKLCPWDLFMLITKAKTMGNCFLCKINGNLLDSPVPQVIFGIKTIFPALSPVIISASILN